MSDKDKEIKELKERLERLEGDQETKSIKKEPEKKNNGCLVSIFIIFLVFFIFSFFTDSDDSGSAEVLSSDEDISMKLTCKFNPNAMYEDRITFNGDMTAATLESTNKNTPLTKYKVKKSGDNLILNGTQTRIDIDNNKELVTDVDLFILTDGKSDYWNRDLYYFSDFETDPVRFLTCHETYNKNKKDISKKAEKPKVDVAKQNREKIISSLNDQGFTAYWGQDISLWIENPGLSKAELERFGYNFCDATKSAGMRKGYVISFWQSLRNGPNGQIAKVRCF
tara:strand:+ start:250 stop:1092 length:843 start_codon:yes stop_codon:yes gene_type:complete